MKKLFFLSVASLLLFSCSKDDGAPAPTGTDGQIVFTISAVNKLNSHSDFSRSAVYSPEAVQHVTNVNVYAFKSDGSGNFLYTRVYAISGWSDGLTIKRYEVADGDKLAAGNYKFLAIGRDATDLFQITPMTVGSTRFDDILAQVASSGNETEIFSGFSQNDVTDKGSRVNIEMTRKVAGVLGYFKNIPQQIDGTNVKFLRLRVSNTNQKVNLTSGTSIDDGVVAYNIIDMDLSGQAVSNGIFAGNDLSAQGVAKVANSQLGGMFLIPVGGVSMVLGLYDANGDPLQTWTVKDSNGGLSSFDIMANHFYSLGVKTKAGSTTGDPSNPGDDDAPIDLLTSQNIVITITPDWTNIHNLIIQ